MIDGAPGKTVAVTGMPLRQALYPSNHGSAVTSLLASNTADPRCGRIWHR